MGQTKRKRDFFGKLPAVEQGTVNNLAISLGLELPTKAPRPIKRLLQTSSKSWVTASHMAINVKLKRKAPVDLS